MAADPAQVLRRCMRSWHLRPDSSTPAGITKNLTQLCRDSRGRRAFLKCAPNPFDVGVSREASALQALPGIVSPRQLRVPAVRHFEPDGQVLALEWISRAPTLYAKHRARRALPLRDLTRLGRALGALHEATRSAAPQWDWAAPPEETLLECFIWTRPEFSTRLSTDGMLLFGIVRGDRAAANGVIELVQDPQHAALIHGDAKALNVLLPSGGAPVLLDWELTQFGDPAQDLGSLAADLLRCQVAPESPTEALGAPAARAGLAAVMSGYGRVSPKFRRRVRLWTGAHLLIYAHAMVLADGVLHALASRLLTRARRLLSEPARD